MANQESFQRSELRDALRAIDRLLEGISDRALLKEINSALLRYLKTVQRGLGNIAPGCVRFEQLPLGSSFAVGGSFAEGPVTVRVEPFQWGNGIWTNLGFSEVENGGLAGGAGQEMEVNNVNLSFAFGGNVGRLTVNVGEYGGNLNLEVNGGFWNFDDFSALPGGQLGGVAVSANVAPIAPPQRGEVGTLELRGGIGSFSIGGQELWIDDVCYE